MILWLKAFHIVFVITWFAALFYLPRLFVYHAAVTDEVSSARFSLMERRLCRLMTLAAILAIGFGFAMLLAVPGYMQTDWLRMKLVLVAALVLYHFWCREIVFSFRNRESIETPPPHTSLWFRWFNEVPTVLLFGIVLLVVLKPGGVH